MDEVDPVGIHEIGKAGRTTNSGNTDDFLVGNAEFLNHVEKGSQNSEIAAGWTPGGMIGLELFFGELFGGSGRGQVRHNKNL